MGPEHAHVLSIPMLLKNACELPASTICLWRTRKRKQEPDGQSTLLNMRLEAQRLESYTDNH